MRMDNTTYGAIKRLVSDAKAYYAELNKDFPRIWGNDVDIAETWLRNNENRNDEIAIVWCIEDIRNVEENKEIPEEDRLTDVECRDVLSYLRNKHDATIGINWDVLEFWMDEVRSQRKGKS
jgi:hypothetical protein